MTGKIVCANIIRQSRSNPSRRTVKIDTARYFSYPEKGELESGKRVAMRSNP